VADLSLLVRGALTCVRALLGLGALAGVTPLVPSAAGGLASSTSFASSLSPGSGVANVCTRLGKEVLSPSGSGLVVVGFVGGKEVFCPRRFYIARVNILEYNRYDIRHGRKQRCTHGLNAARYNHSPFPRRQ
jgi:hypothetical protein